MRPVICRTLRREYRLHPPTAEIGVLLAFVEAEPALPGLSPELVDVPIHFRDGFLVASMPGGESIEGTPSHLIGAMHRMVVTDLVEGDPDAPFIHGATVVVEGRRVLTDVAAPLRILYIARLDDPAQIDPMLADVIATRLAADLSYSLTASAALGQTLMSVYQARLAEARATDAEEGVPDPLVSTWGIPGGGREWAR